MLYVNNEGDKNTKNGDEAKPKITPWQNSKSLQHFCYPLCRNLNIFLCVSVKAGIANILVCESG